MKKNYLKGALASLLFFCAVTPAAVQASPSSKTMNRLYNPNSGEHFYTCNTKEKNYLVEVGWKDEGIGWIAPALSSEPVFRLYNPNEGDHHYTLSENERDYLVKAGWNDEGIGWYSDEEKSVPLYRQYNPNAKAGAHNFTTELRENDYLVSVGWNAEGIGWYGLENVSSDEPVKEEAKIIYYLNDGAPAAWKIDWQKTGIPVTLPEDPQRSGYHFTGWYTDTDCTQPYDVQSILKDDLVLYAGWKNDNEDYALGSDPDSPSETVQSLTEISVLENSFSVTYNTNVPAVIRVSVMDEETGDVLYEDASRTLSYAEMEDLNIPFFHEMPETYLLKAEMADESGNSLCQPLIVRKYTKQWKTYESQTAEDDYGDSVVVNFDDRTDTNFGVLKEGTIVLNQSDSINQLNCVIEKEVDEDNENIFYTYPVEFTIANPDETALSLQAGDVFLGYTGDLTLQICKIDSVENRDGLLIIKPDLDATLSDYYSVVKAESLLTGSAAQPAYIQGEMAPVSPQPRVDIIDVDNDISWNLNVGPTVNFSDHISLETDVSVEGKTHVTIYYDAHLFGPDYIETDFVNSTKYTVAAELIGEINNDVDKKEEDKIKKEKKTLFSQDLNIPTPIPGVSFNAHYSVPLEMSLSGSVKFQVEGTTKNGFKYSTDSGRQIVDKKEKHMDLTPKAEGSIKFGGEVGLGFSLFHKVVKIGATAFVGAKVEAKASSSLGTDLGNDQDSHHMCQFCVSAEAKLCLEADAKLSYNIVEIVQGDVFKINILTLELPVHFGKNRGAYGSVIHTGSPVFPEIHPYFGFGDCPNTAYKTQLTALNEQGETSSETTVSFIAADTNAVLKKGKGTVTAYLFDGKYVIEAQYPNKTVRRNIVVSKGASAHTLKETSGDPVITGTVKDAENDTPVNNAKILIQKNGSVIDSIETDANGKYRSTVSEGIYLITITKDDYLPFKQYIHAKDGETLTVDGALMVRTGATEPGGIEGTITNSINGSPIGSASIEIFEGWDNDGYTAPLYSRTTDSDGWYRVERVRVFGVTVGILPGNYTVRVSRNSYITASFNIVILPGEDRTSDFPLTPVGAENIYRVVLRWGADPSDLDAHYRAGLKTGSDEHVFYSAQNGETAQLDVDDTSSYGPETITVTDFDALDNGFIYSVHDFSNKDNPNSLSLSSSGAIVQLYKGADLLETYHVPTGQPANVWRVFSIDQNHQIHRLDEMTSTSDASAVRSLSMKKQ